MASRNRVNLKMLDCTSIAGPNGDPWYVDPSDPAISAMTDFHERCIVTVEPHFPVDKALEIMKHAGVRAAFVSDGAGQQILGLITAYDILGEKPLRQLRAMGGAHGSLSRSDVLVRDLMDRTRDWLVVLFQELEGMTVAAVMNSLESSGRTHLPVIERRDGKNFSLRGIFSAAKLLRLTEFSRSVAA